jgi:hypothetical protein
LCPAGQSFAGNSNSANNEFEPLTNSYYPPPLPPSYQLNPQLSDENVHMDELDYRNNNQEQLTLGGIDSQINHEALQQIFGLSETKLALAKNILEVLFLFINLDCFFDNADADVICICWICYR